MAGYVFQDKSSAQNIEFGELVSILFRRLTTILLVAALFLLAAMLYILSTDTLYTSTTSILVDPRQGRSLSVESAVNLAADTGQLESQLKLVTSQTVLRRVVENEKLLNDDEFGPAKPGVLRRILSVIGRSVTAPTQQDKLDIAVDALSKNITVKRSERTYVIDIQVATREAAKSARLANAVAKAYMDDASEARSEAIRLETDYVRQRLTSLQGKLQEAEERVAVFKEKNKIFDASGKLVNDEQITNISNEVVQARSRTAEAKAKYEQVQRAVKAGRGIDAIGDAQKSTVLERLRTQAAEIARLEANLRTTLGPRHPQLQEVQQQALDTRRLIDEELRRLVQGSANEFQVARSSEASLESELERLRGIAGATNQTLPQLRELERNVEAQRSAFEKLSKAGDTISQQGADTPIARVIASALVPDGPSSPRKIPILALALVSGFGFGTGLALLRESASRKKLLSASIHDDRDQRAARLGRVAHGSQASTIRQRLRHLNRWFRRGTDPASAEAGPIKSATGPMDSVAAVPFFSQAEVNNPHSAAVDHPGLGFSVAMRARTTSILRSLAGMEGAGPKFLYVTSIEDGAGKTVFALNFAFIAAQAGARVLLIDANQHQPSLSVYATDHGHPGLITAMGRLRPAFSIEKAGLEPVLVIAASDGNSQTSARLKETLHTFFDGDIDVNFDLVVIDGAAAGQASGDREFGDSADLILLVGSEDVADEGCIAMVAKAFDCAPSKIAPVPVVGLAPSATG